MTETVQLTLDKQLVDWAGAYAKDRGEDLSSLIEAYLRQVAAQINVAKANESPKAKVEASLDPELRSIMGIASTLKDMNMADDERFSYIMSK